MIGLFIFIPTIIHQFELDIDKSEFQSLVSSSILVEKNKLFDAFDDDENDSIDINEFVSNLLKSKFRTKVISSNIPKQNRLRAWFECNIIRHRLYNNFVLILFYWFYHFY